MTDKDKILIDAYHEAKLDDDPEKVIDMQMEPGLCISETAANTKYYENSLTAHVTTRAYRAPEIMLL